jgi:Tfp pilus assembly protein PilX
MPIPEAMDQGAGWTVPGDERGIALVMALGVLVALTIAVISLTEYTSHLQRQARLSSASQKSYHLAEAGINEAAAVLNLSTNNALNADLLPLTNSTYDGGTVTRSGTLDPSSSVWTVTATGRVSNPTGAAPVTRTIRATIRVTPALSSTLNNQAWNYIYDFGTGQPCDMTITQSVQVSSPLFVEGNLCLQNTSTITSGPLAVKGKLTLSQKSNAIGSSSAPISEAHIGNGCQYWNNATHNPCQGAVDNVFVADGHFDTTPPPISVPAIDWNGLYANASPGPKFPCYAPNSSPSSTWPVFENETVNPTRNDSVPAAWNLTPATAYDCWTGGGELKWDPAAHLLTARGTIFIDGSAYVQNGALNTYTGQATLYLSGTFLLKNSQLCAVASGSTCDTENWNPNTRLLIVVANGNGDNGLPAGDSVQLVSGTFQGGVFASNTIQIDTTSSINGPIVGKIIDLGQSTTTVFPFITIVPAGAPGNPNVLALVGAPTYGG